MLDAAPPGRARRWQGLRLTLADLRQAQPPGRWEPRELRAMAGRIHDSVPHGAPELEPEVRPRPTLRPDYPRLDSNAGPDLGREGVHVHESAIHVQLEPRNRELLTLASAWLLWAGGSMVLVAILTLTTGLAGTWVPKAPLAPPTAALGASMDISAHVAVLGALSVLTLALGTVGLLCGLYTFWLSMRSTGLAIGLHGIRLGQLQISYDEILAVQTDSGSLCFELLDGSCLVTPAGLLDDAVANTLRDEVARRLPSDRDRAAGFVAFEHARRSLRMGL